MQVYPRCISDCPYDECIYRSVPADTVPAKVLRDSGSLCERTATTILYLYFPNSDGQISRFYRKMRSRGVQGMKKAA